MIRRLLSITALGVVAGLGSVAPAVAASAPAPLEVVAVDTAKSPDVTMTVAAPHQLAGRDIPASAFVVEENGRRRAVHVTNVPSDPLEVVLVVDTSGSMHGAPLVAAQDAAKTFLAKMPSGTRVAVVGIGTTPYVASPFTTDMGALSAAITHLAARGETSLYDSLITASRLFPTGSARRSIVLLSDGGDTRSIFSLDVAGAKLAEAKAAFYGVGLSTPESDPAALDRLAAATGGKIVPAGDPTALAGVYNGIAAELVSEYGISYRSTAHGVTPVTVKLNFEGVAARTSRTIELPAATPVVVPAPASTAPRPVTTSPPVVVKTRGVIDNAFVPIVGVSVLALALLLAGIATFWPGASRSQLQGSRGTTRDQAVGRLVGLAHRATEMTEQSLERGGRVRTLNTALERAGIAARSGEFVLGTAVAALVAFALVSLLWGWIAGAIAVGASVLGAWAFVSVRTQRRGAQFSDQLEQTLSLMAGALRAGFGLMQAIDTVARESESPTSDEFRRLIVEARLGRDLSDSLTAMANRVHNEDLEWVVQAIEIHRQVGGDLAEILDNIGTTIRDRSRVRRRIRTLTAEGRVSAWVLFLMPFFMAATMQLLRPGYLDPLTSSSLGQVLLIAGAGLMVIGGLWLRRIVRLVF